jgi:hypothetical protein
VQRAVRATATSIMSDPRPLGPGDPVEVFVRYNQSWVPGFEIAAITRDGYQVRRSGDRSLLPSITGAADLRPAT